MVGMDADNAVVLPCCTAALAFSTARVYLYIYGDTARVKLSRKRDRSHDPRSLWLMRNVDEC